MTNTIKRQAKTHYLTEFPSIFKPIKRGAREKAVEINYEYKNGSKIQVWMFKQLDIADQDLFLAIVSLVAEYSRGILGQEDTQNLVTKNLREKLKLKNNLFELPILKLETTIFKLLETMGRNDGKMNYKWCLEALERLSRCGIGYNTDKYIGNSNLISFEVDKNTKVIYIALNPVSASVFLSNDKYVIHNLKERYMLKLDASKALLSYLNRLIGIGQKKPLYLDTLINGVYGETTPDEKKNRKRTILKAIEELKTHNEYIFEEGLNNSFIIKRNKILSQGVLNV